MPRRNALPVHIADPGDNDLIATLADLTSTIRALHVAVLDGSGNQVTSFGGGTSQSDDGAFTPGTSSLTPIGFFADETTPDSVDEGDVGLPRMSLDRFIYVTAMLASDVIRAGGASLTPLYAAVGAATSGDNTVVASVVGKKIRVIAIALIAAAAVNLYFTSNAGGTVIFGGSTNKVNLDANGGFILGFNPAGWFETASGQDLIMNLSGAVSVAGAVTYVTV